MNDYDKVKYNSRDKPVCPNCKSNRLTKAGINYQRTTNKQRWICKDCRRITVQSMTK